MQPLCYSDRLREWHLLREGCASLPVQDCLARINYWWMHQPWCAYRLHWDDQPSWPDPWQLLEEKELCDLARGLGIMYTVCLMDRTDITDATLVEVGNGNLVHVCAEKYILNWNTEVVVSNHTKPIKCRRQISQQQLQKLIQ